MLLVLMNSQTNNLSEIKARMNKLKKDIEKTKNDIQKLEDQVEKMYVNVEDTVQEICHALDNYQIQKNTHAADTTTVAIKKINRHK